MIRLTNRIRKAVRALGCVALVLLIGAAVPEPAAAQFWNQLFGGQRQAPPRMVPQRGPFQQPYNPFNTLFGIGGDPRRQQQQDQKQAPRDYSQAPPPARRSSESQAAITSPILVLGDAMADWLAYGLEDAFSEKPEFGIVRKHRSYSGLVRYDPRRDIEWPQVARETIAAEKPKFIVMMVGYHDRQAIRDRTPTPTTPGRGAPQQSTDPYLDPDSPESRARASADAQNAEMRKAQGGGSSSGQQKSAAPPSGPLEFQSETWQAAYIQRIDATIAALKTANVPVFWVGLPPQRVARLSTDASYLNDLYRARAERAGIVFVDIWDGFVDEAGRYVVQGPDLEGQTRRLRSGDGVYFTAAGARKLAHYVEREILRSQLSSPTPVALPLPEPAVPGRPGASRPLAGPVIPLTATLGGGTELLGGGPTRPTRSDPLMTRVLVRGEPVTAPVGRADNFAWPRGGDATVREAEPEPEESAPQAAVQPPAQTAPQAAPPRPPLRTSSQTPPGAQPKPAPQQKSPPPAAPNVASRPKTQQPSDGKPPAQRRPRNDNVPRPPLPLFPFLR
jgi:hypothetical protein